MKFQASLFIVQHFNTHEFSIKKLKPDRMKFIKASAETEKYWRHFESTKFIVMYTYLPRIFQIFYSHRLLKISTLIF